MSALGYVGIALLVALETFIPPIPSEVVLPASGFLVGRGELDLWGVLLASTLGSVAGALGLYAIARRVGRARVDGWVARHGKWLTLSNDEVDRAYRWFERRGPWAVFLGRLAPGVRSLVSVPAGLVRMPVARFTALTAAGSLLWNSLLVYAGSVLGENWGAVEPYYSRVETALWVLLGVALGWRWVHKRREAKRTAPEDGGGGGRTA